MNFKLLSVLALAAGGLAHQSRADGPYTVPIYVDSASNYSPDRYTIYAGMSGGISPNTSIVPYLFDTGAPNMFSTLGGEGQTATAGFSFAQGLTYNYYLNGVTVTLGDNAGNPIVSTGTVNVASVVSITSGNSTSFTHNNALADGTYGDFGAGLYGNNTLATILNQFPLSPGLIPGYLVNVAGVTSGNGSLTIGLTPAAIAAAKNTPGSIVMPMSLSGNVIPTTNGDFINGYNKAQVANATLAVDGLNGSFNGTIPLVLDTGGGENVVIYSTNFGPGSSGTESAVLSGNNQLILFYDQTTPYGGNVDIVHDVSGGERINPGGAAIYENYQVMFILSANSSIPGEVVLVPYQVPEPAQSALLASAAAFGLLGLLRRRKSGK